MRNLLIFIALISCILPTSAVISNSFITVPGPTIFAKSRYMYYTDGIINITFTHTGDAYSGQLQLYVTQARPLISGSCAVTSSYYAGIGFHRSLNNGTVTISFDISTSPSIRGPEAYTYIVPSVVLPECTFGVSLYAKNYEGKSIGTIGSFNAIAYLPNGITSLTPVNMFSSGNGARQVININFLHNGYAYRNLTYQFRGRSGIVLTLRNPSKVLFPPNVGDFQLPNTDFAYPRLNCTTVGCVPNDWYNVSVTTTNMFNRSSTIYWPTEFYFETTSPRLNTTTDINNQRLATLSIDVVVPVKWSNVTIIYGQNRNSTYQVTDNGTISFALDHRQLSAPTFNLQLMYQAPSPAPNTFAESQTAGRLLPSTTSIVGIRIPNMGESSSTPVIATPCLGNFGINLEDYGYSPVTITVSRNDGQAPYYVFTAPKCSITVDVNNPPASRGVSSIVAGTGIITPGLYTIRCSAINANNVVLANVSRVFDLATTDQVSLTSSGINKTISGNARISLNAVYDGQITDIGIIDSTGAYVDSVNTPMFNVDLSRLQCVEYNRQWDVPNYSYRGQARFKSIVDCSDAYLTTSSFVRECETEAIGLTIPEPHIGDELGLHITVPEHPHDNTVFIELRDGADVIGLLGLSVYKSLYIVSINMTDPTGENIDVLRWSSNFTNNHTYDVVVRYQDTALNPMSFATESIVIDTEPPHVNVVVPSYGREIANHTVITVNVSESGTALITFEPIDYPELAVYFSCSTTTGTNSWIVDTVDNYIDGCSVSGAGSIHPDLGRYTIRIEASDAVYRTGAAEVTDMFVIRETPVISIVSPVSGFEGRETTLGFVVTGHPNGHRIDLTMSGRTSVVISQTGSYINTTVFTIPFTPSVDSWYSLPLDFTRPEGVPLKWFIGGDTFDVFIRYVDVNGVELANASILDIHLECVTTTPVILQPLNGSTLPPPLTVTYSLPDASSWASLGVGGIEYAYGARPSGVYGENITIIDGMYYILLEYKDIYGNGALGNGSILASHRVWVNISTPIVTNTTVDPVEPPPEPPTINSTSSSSIVLHVALSLGGTSVLVAAGLAYWYWVHMSRTAPSETMRLV